MSNKEILERPLSGLHHTDIVGKHITTLHRWWRRRLTTSGVCQSCDSMPKYLDLSNISGEYKNEKSDWVYLCRSCHRKYDKRRVNTCRHGHEYTPENTVSRDDGTRTCKECRREAVRRWKARQQS